MKKLILFISVVTILFGGGITSAVDIEVRTGLNYDWWESDSDDQGEQFFIPIQIDAQYEDFSCRVLTAYTYTSLDPSGGQDQSLSNIVDTKVNLSYKILEKFPVDILFGLDLNLPTGRTDLEEKELYLIMDPDLISITSLGEGFNINPIVTLAREWDKWVAGMGLGYMWRGEYDYSSNYKDYDPGDIFNLCAEVAYDFSPEWRSRLFGDYAQYGKGEVDNTDFYQEGDFFSVGLGVHHYQSTWDAGLTIKGIFRDKSEIQPYQGATSISTEDKNSHGDEWHADLSGRYFLDDKTTLNSALEFLWIDKNGYSSDSDFYIGKRNKISLGFGIVRLLRTYLEAELNVKGFYLDEDENWYHPDDDRDYKGFSIGAKLTSRF
ncbi:MAG: hypothetical protein BA873_08365 [Desulfobulbaceae bacterium C00003063]|nr:MAG: hypothetical protein BA873_08365 [Desulfobulbaceae bacterium C00003063]